MCFCGRNPPNCPGSRQKTTTWKRREKTTTRRAAQRGETLTMTSWKTSATVRWDPSVHVYLDEKKIEKHTQSQDQISRLQSRVLKNNINTHTEVPIKRSTAVIHCPSSLLSLLSLCLLLSSQNQLLIEEHWDGHRETLLCSCTVEKMNFRHDFSSAPSTGYHYHLLLFSSEKMSLYKSCTWHRSSRGYQGKSGHFCLCTVHVFVLFLFVSHTLTYSF